MINFEVLKKFMQAEEFFLPKHIIVLENSIFLSYRSVQISAQKFA